MHPPGKARRRSAAAPLAALLALVWAATVSPAAAQELRPMGVVTGAVVEADSGRPVPWAAVEIAAGEDGAGAVRETSSDRNGRYRITGLGPGWYRITVTRLGYRPARMWVELPTDRRIERSLGLEVEPVALRAVAVSVGRARGAWPVGEGGAGGGAAAASVFGVGGDRPTLDAQALSTRDIEDVPALGEPDILRALQGLPGASARGDFTAGLWTRGSPWGMTRLLLDGLPVFHPLHLGGTLSGMTPEGLDAAVFLPGARPAPLAEGASGTVNLVTRRASPTATRSAGVTPIALRGHVEDRFLDDRIGVWVTARRSWWDVVPPPRLFAGDAASSGAIEYWFGDVSGRADVRLGARTLLEAGGLWERDRIDGTVRDLVWGSTGHWGNRVGWLALAGTGHGLRGRVTVGYSEHRSETRPTPAAVLGGRDRPTLDANELDLARALLRLELGGAERSAVDWSVGLDRARQTLRQHGQAAVDRGVPGVDGAEALGWTRAWGQASTGVGPVRVAGGVGLDLPVGETDELDVATRHLSARLRLSDAVSLEIAEGVGRQHAWPIAPAGRSYGPGLTIHPVWTMAVGGRPPLVSRTSTASAGVTLPDGFGGRLTAWWRTVDGLSMEGISAVDDEGRLVPVFLDGLVGRERGRGVEAVLWRRAGRVRGELGYSRGRSRILAPGGESWPSPSDRTHSMDLLVSYQASPTLRLGGTWRYESGWPYVVGPWLCPETPTDGCVPVGDPTRPEEYSVRRAPPFRHVDLSVDWLRPGDRFTWALHLSVRNVLGTDNREAWRPEGCLGGEVISLTCETATGPGTLATGLTRPTPAFAVRVYF